MVSRSELEDLRERDLAWSFATSKDLARASVYVSKKDVLVRRIKMVVCHLVFTLGAIAKPAALHGTAFSRVFGINVANSATLDRGE
eukprot:CAMPEP_0115729882 /NCGR_PEP_ID=MMETSP0272-20121206/83750_1 /TAXON_ID=71861 /ORGANISM="Scrippsiella trochoidea, Strain CCMP3099" /LENGTH=85 /DNA_ID=CAMNT_0003173605 /DNA_START=83 /DNA_END=339 /DNA_ORIENTATION=-